MQEEDEDDSAEDFEDDYEGDISCKFWPMCDEMGCNLGRTRDGKCTRKELIG